jgi:alkylhydroperoxidase/carboxymuconolactone decarboxylase family protein YurZ
MGGELTTKTRPGTVAHLAEVAGAPGEALKGFVDALYADTVLDPKTRELIFLAVQTALNLEAAVRAHVPRAVQAGASRDEIVAAMMISVANAGLSGALHLVPLVDELVKDLVPAR